MRIDVIPGPAVLTVAFALLASPLASQRKILIVDQNGGGSHRSIPAAIKAAKDGDLLLVRKGNYIGFRTGKAITILCDRQVQIQAFSIVRATIEITGVAKGKSFIMKGGVIPVLGVHIKDCKGRVLLEDTFVQGTQFNSFSRSKITVERSHDVSFHGVKALGHPALKCIDSTVSLLDCALMGTGTSITHASPTAGLALSGTRSRIEIAGGSLVGGAGNSGAFQPPSAAVWIGSKTSMMLRGDRSTTVRTGSPGGSKQAVSAILGTGTLLLDSTLSVLGANQAPALAKTLQITRQRIPALWMTGAGPGATIRGQIYSPKGDLVWVFHGLVGNRISLPIFGGDFGLDLSLLIPVGSGTQGVGEHFSFSLNMPNIPTLRGLEFGWQGFSWNARRGLLLTNRVSSVHF